MYRMLVAWDRCDPSDESVRERLSILQELLSTFGGEVVNHGPTTRVHVAPASPNPSLLRLVRLGRAGLSGRLLRLERDRD